MGKFEVSNAEWALVWKTNNKLPPSLPVVEVSHTRAMSYCRELTILLKIMNVLPKGHVCRLPTEAEWEFAARGGLTNKKYPWGNDDSIARDHANYEYICGKDKWDTQTAPVGSFLPNKYNLHDMVGNVYEWCQD